MKKLLTLSLAVMLVCALCVVVSATEWKAGNGYNIVERHEEGGPLIQAEANTPVTVTKNQDGTTKVSHGGYYQDGTNWGGVASVEKFDYKNLSVKVRFDKVPAVEPGQDCWAYIGILQKPEIFKVGAVDSNKGFMNLIRFSNSKWEIYNGITEFKSVEGMEGPEFAIKSGDVVTMTFVDAGGGYYTVKYQNGEGVTYTPETLFDGTVFADGGHVVVSASCVNSAKDAFEYTILEVKNVEGEDPFKKYKENDPEPGVVKVFVADERVTFDQPPVIEEGRTLVPLRAIFEALDCYVEWDDATKTVTAFRGDDEIKLTIGSADLYKNGEVVATLDVPAKIINSRTLVPVRAISEAFGCNVSWVDETKTVVVRG